MKSIKTIKIAIIDADAHYEIDHIYPQELFANTITIDKALMESIGNKAPLPKSVNIAKSKLSLKQLQADITKQWVFNETLLVTGISIDDVDKYSDVSNLKELINERVKDYKEVFNNNRNNLFNNRL